MTAGDTINNFAKRIRSDLIKGCFTKKTHLLGNIFLIEKRCGRSYGGVVDGVHFAQNSKSLGFNFVPRKEPLMKKNKSRAFSKG